MKLYNKDFRNAYLMFGIMTAMFVFMGISLVLVGENVSSNRSCITTCDVDLQSEKAKETKTIPEKRETDGTVK